jgi:hypothetical protein
MQETDDLLVGALTPDDEEVVEIEWEMIIQTEMAEVPEDVRAAGEPALTDVPSEPGSQQNCVLVWLLYIVFLLPFLFLCTVQKI